MEFANGLFGLFMPAPIREPDQIRQDAACKLRSVGFSDHFQAILGEAWTTPRLVEAHERFSDLMDGKRFQVVNPIPSMDLLGVYVLLVDAGQH